MSQAAFDRKPTCSKPLTGEELLCGSCLSVLLSHEGDSASEKLNPFDLVSEESLGCVECTDTCSVCVISSHS